VINGGSWRELGPVPRTTSERRGVTIRSVAGYGGTERDRGLDATTADLVERGVGSKERRPNTMIGRPRREQRPLRSRQATNPLRMGATGTACLGGSATETRSTAGGRATRPDWRATPHRHLHSGHRRPPNQYLFLRGFFYLEVSPLKGVRMWGPPEANGGGPTARRYRFGTRESSLPRARPRADGVGPANACSRAGGPGRPSLRPRGAQAGRGIRGPSAAPLPIGAIYPGPASSECP